MKQIYIFKHNPNPNAPLPSPIPLVLGFLPWTLILTTPSLKKILDPLLDIGLVWNLLTPRFGLLFLQDASKAKVTIPYLASRQHSR